MNKEETSQYNKLWREAKKRGENYSVFQNRPRKTENYKEYRANYYLEHRNKIIKRSKKWLNENRASANEYRSLYRKAHPWIKTLGNIRYRCNNKNDKKYAYYGGRGIKCFLSMADIKGLWLRDKADNMIQPSIDRFDANGNYTLENCRFIEMSENRTKTTRVVHKTCKICDKLRKPDCSSALCARHFKELARQYYLKGRAKKCLRGK